MAIYYRSILKREPINRWGRIGYREYLEIVQTENISKFNYRKKDEISIICRKRKNFHRRRKTNIF